MEHLFGYALSPAAKCPLPVPVDIRPCSCHNPIKVRTWGVLPVAIMGTQTLDVTHIDPASIRLEGVAPLR